MIPYKKCRLLNLRQEPTVPAVYESSGVSGDMVVQNKIGN